MSCHDALIYSCHFSADIAGYYVSFRPYADAAASRPLRVSLRFLIFILMFQADISFRHIVLRSSKESGRRAKEVHGVMQAMRDTPRALPPWRHADK